ncbi:restriction endonuclease subunit S [Flavonifractor plautii]|uniref:restriction endonuclease subunit S n=1 Tax=Flavonifractor plautii TaxID=292800 RepID=UPI00214BB8A1|nr:restriction endonuclease subunit S [Flavonifractor plautii]MCR1908819.1 restriction endonuclease subunit S [Flavonifractor plautii]
MRTMKDSGIEWIGDIPADWNIKRVKSVLCERNESNNPIQTDEILSLTNDRGVIPYEEKGDVGNKSKEDLTGYKLAYPGDIVLNSMNVFIGSVGLSSYFGCVSPVYYMLYPRNKNDSVSFFNYLFQTKELQTKLHGYGNGIMEIRMRIQMSKLNSVQLPVPPSDIQHKIAAYLDCKCSQIDTIIARQKEVIEKLKAYKLSVITEAVTSTDSQMCRFRNCITTIEQGWSPAPAEIVGEDGWFVLSLSAVKNGKFIKLSKKPIDANENIPTKLSIKVGDLLMTRSNTRELVGDVCLVDSDCPKTIFSDLIYRISLNDTLLPCYAIFLLQSAFIRQQIQESARGSSGTMPKISHKSIKNLNIYLPSIPEQREISGFLRNKCNCIDTCIQEKERLIKKLTAYKKSLIYEVVTGKKEV